MTVTQMATMVGAVIGTPQYMSPEQATGGAVDQRSDIYSLACVLFEMLAGHPPFVAATADALLRMHVTAEPRPVTESRPAVPAALARIVARGLAKLPDDRFASTAQFAEAIAAATTDVTPRRDRRRPRRRPRHNLPRPRTQFIGREREIAECVRLLGDTRLLTLTGIGGSGKTRLAIRVAEADRVELSRTASGSSTWRRSATRHGCWRRSPARSASARAPARISRSSLRDHVSGRRLLLVLDNCEHLLAAVAGAGRRPPRGRRRTAGAGHQPRGARRRRASACSRSGRCRRPPPRRARHAARSRHPTPCSSSSIARSGSRPTSRSPTATRRPSPRSAGGSTASRWRWSWRPRGVKLLSVEQIAARLDDRFRLLTGGEDGRCRGSRRCRRRSSGATTCSPPTSSDCSARCRCSSEAGRSRSRRACGRQTTPTSSRCSTCSRGWWTSRWCWSNRRADGDTRYTLLETVRQYAAERLMEQRRRRRRSRRRHAEGFLAIAERAYAERVTKEATLGGAPGHRARQRPRGAGVACATAIPRSTSSCPERWPGSGRRARTCSRDAST